jgi:hypothetical protein
MGQRLEPILLFFGQNQCLFGPSGSHLSPYILDATPHDLVHLFLGQETRDRRHQLPADCRIRSKDVLGGLHHEYWLEKVAA